MTNAKLNLRPDTHQGMCPHRGVRWPHSDSAAAFPSSENTTSFTLAAQQECCAPKARGRSHPKSGCGEQKSSAAFAGLAVRFRSSFPESGRRGRAHAAYASRSWSNCDFRSAKARFKLPKRLPRVRRAGRCVNGEDQAKRREKIYSRFHRIADQSHEHWRLASTYLLKACASCKEKASHCNRNGAARDADFADFAILEFC